MRLKNFCQDFQISALQNSDFNRRNRHQSQGHPKNSKILPNISNISHAHFDTYLQMVAYTAEDIAQVNDNKLGGLCSYFQI